MRILWFRKKRKEDDVGVREAVQEREKSEERLREAQREVIWPLHEMIQKNHVGEMITSLIQKRAGERE